MLCQQQAVVPYDRQFYSLLRKPTKHHSLIVCFAPNRFYILSLVLFHSLPQFFFFSDRFIVHSFYCTHFFTNTFQDLSARARNQTLWQENMLFRAFKLLNWKYKSNCIIIIKKIIILTLYCHELANYFWFYRLYEVKILV